jgi:hypothetical protein
MFEYKILKYQPQGFVGSTIDYDLAEKEINELAKMGWEIISVLNTTQASGSTRDFVVTLKRQT